MCFDERSSSQQDFPSFEYIYTAIYLRDHVKPLKSPPVLLEGGFEEYERAILKNEFPAKVALDRSSVSQEAQAYPCLKFVSLSSNYGDVSVAEDRPTADGMPLFCDTDNMKSKSRLFPRYSSGEGSDRISSDSISYPKMTINNEDNTKGQEAKPDSSHFLADYYLKNASKLVDIGADHHSGDSFGCKAVSLPKGATGTAGLLNLGNTCFMNSIIQCINATSILTRYFLSGAFRKHVNKRNAMGTRGFVAESYSELLEDIWSSGYSFVSPKNFRVSVYIFVSMCWQSFH